MGQILSPEVLSLFIYVDKQFSPFMEPKVSLLLVTFINQLMHSIDTFIVIKICVL